jgi:hypothetical protein
MKTIHIFLFRASTTLLEEQELKPLIRMGPDFEGGLEMKVEFKKTKV